MIYFISHLAIRVQSFHQGILGYSQVFFLVMKKNTFDAEVILLSNHYIACVWFLIGSSTQDTEAQRAFSRGATSVSWSFFSFFGHGSRRFFWWNTLHDLYGCCVTKRFRFLAAKSIGSS